MFHFMFPVSLFVAGWYYKVVLIQQR